jgi:phospholipase/carboxylesterase
MHNKEGGIPMKHIYVEGKCKDLPTLLLLHGTGGNERDLLSVAEMIAPEAAVLGVKGNVSENGMPRFFRRLREGVFDIEDLILRTQELHEHVNEFAEQYKFDRNRVVAVGYSNGANIAANLLYQIENSLSGAVLLHAMVPQKDIKIPNLNNIPVFLGAGEKDSMIAPDQTRELSKQLQQAGAKVTEFWTPGGHQLTREELVEAQKWFHQQYQA